MAETSWIERLAKLVEEKRWLEALEFLAEEPERVKVLENGKEFVRALATNALAAGADPVRVYELVSKLGVEPPVEALDKAVFNLLVSDTKRGLEAYRRLKDILPREGYAASYARAIESGLLELVEAMRRGDFDKAVETALNIDLDALENLVELGVMDRNFYEKIVELSRNAKRLLESKSALERIALNPFIPREVRETAKKLMKAGAEEAYKILSQMDPEHARLLAAAWLYDVKPTVLPEKFRRLLDELGVRYRVVPLEEIDKEFARKIEEYRRLLNELNTRLEKILELGEKGAYMAAAEEARRLLKEWDKFKPLIEAGLVKPELRKQVEKIAAQYETAMALKLIEEARRVEDVKRAKTLLRRARELLEKAGAIDPAARALFDIAFKGVDPMEIIRCVAPEALAAPTEVVRVGPRSMYAIR